MGWSEGVGDSELVVDTGKAVPARYEECDLVN